MFSLILGPMKSGKSLELIAQVAPYEHTEKNVVYVQPEANTRDKGIQSRLGVNATALTINSLCDVEQPFDVIGIDEVHMFPETDKDIVEKWIHKGKNIIASGLDLDYRGKMLPIILRLHELKPDVLITKHAVCDACKEYNAHFTQILTNQQPILGGLDAVTIDDGSYDFQARCRDCFQKD